MKRPLSLFLAALFLVALRPLPAAPPDPPPVAPKARITVQLTVRSAAFAHHGDIPRDHTCDGGDRIPPLEVAGIPEGARTLVLVVDDPDAPGGTWYHWLLYNVPVAGPSLRLKSDSVPGAQGANSWGHERWQGPCPPPGPAHRYHFRVYATDLPPDLPAGLAPADLSARLKGHVLASGLLIGRYQRRR